MKNRLSIALVFASALLVACGSAKRDERRAAFELKLNSFIGQSIDAVIQARGVPSATASLTTGGRVIEYSQSRLETSGGGSYTTYTSVYTPGPNGGTITQIPIQNHTAISTYEANCKILFSVSSTNVVESWKSEGNNCY